MKILYKPFQDICYLTNSREYKNNSKIDSAIAHRDVSSRVVAEIKVDKSMQGSF